MGEKFRQYTLFIKKSEGQVIKCAECQDLIKGKVWKRERMPEFGKFEFDGYICNICYQLEQDRIKGTLNGEAISNT